jgi:hypothetical protein
MVDINDINDINGTCQKEDSLFTLMNLCRVFFYTPIVFFSGVLGSIAYDYITYKEPEKVTEGEDVEEDVEEEVEEEGNKSD